MTALIGFLDFNLSIRLVNALQDFMRLISDCIF